MIFSRLPTSALRLPAVRTYTPVMHCPEAVAPTPQDLPSFAFNVTLMAREGLTGGTQLMAATVSVSNVVPRLFLHSEFLMACSGNVGRMEAPGSASWTSCSSDT